MLETPGDTAGVMFGVAQNRGHALYGGGFELVYGLDVGIQLRCGVDSFVPVCED